MNAVAALVATLALSPAVATAPPRISLAAPPPRSVVVGSGWTATILVRPPTTQRVELVAARGGQRLVTRATRVAPGRHRARLVFRVEGRWSISVRVGRVTRAVGAVVVRPAIPPPLAFAVPVQVALERSGTLLIAENGRNRIARVDPATSAVTTLVEAQAPFGVAVAPDGAVLFSSDQLLRRRDPSGTVTTLAEAPSDVGPIVVDGQGTVYFATDGRVWRIDPRTGQASPFAGTGTSGFAGDGGPASAALLSAPHGLAVNADGALLIADTGNDRIRRVDPTTGTIATYASTPDPGGIALGPDGTLYVAEILTNRVSRVDRAGARTVFAGNGALASTGDGRPAAEASVRTPAAVAAAPDGTVYVLEGGVDHEGRIRAVAPNGTISTLRAR